MKMRLVALTVIGFLAIACITCIALAQEDADTSSNGERTAGRSMLEFITAGGPIGYVIILLSFAGVALVIDGFLRVRPEKLIPPQILETEVLRAPVVVCTLPLWDVFDVLPKSELPHWYVEWIDNVKSKVASVGWIYYGLDGMPEVEGENFVFH